MSDIEMTDADLKAQHEEDLDEKYPNRPHNHGKTLPFHVLFLDLFNPLNDNKKRPTGPAIARRRRPDHPTMTPHEARRVIIERFISRWRRDVGDDIYSAFRLIIPEKDRERAVYGLKEKAIGKLLVRIIKIDKNSSDGLNLLNWKLPGGKSGSNMAGDFAGRCYEVISKRPMRTEVGDMTIEQVNEKLDRLSIVQKEEAQLPIMQEFYNRMNAEELMWLVRIILRQMKVGATEKTFFDVWHPDAEVLFNVSSSLRRVCWELHNPEIRLQDDETDINLMQSFQPQLAQFQMHSFDKMIQKMQLTIEDDVFWIEEKLDGERMQLHMIQDSLHPGGFRFAFWSRKAKDYTYLYGHGLEDEQGSLTRHLKKAFHEGVRNIILDGEMLSWLAEHEKYGVFGSLKGAALAEQKNTFGNKEWPIFRIFDILYLNDEALTRYTLRDRRKALEASVKPVFRRFEIHDYFEARSSAEIEPKLRQVVAADAEGLVIKNPRSAYRLNERNDDWMKVKPEYMTGFGESFDCIVIGGYFGSGHRGGNHSSFMCGVRVNPDSKVTSTMKCYSFFKVGGGFSAADYSSIRHKTEGKWHDWDKKNPPSTYIELGGHELNKQFEQPDQWIRPDESIVISVKGSSLQNTPQFRTGCTLRFPRFRYIRHDRDWTSSLAWDDFTKLRDDLQHKQEERQFTLEGSRQQRNVKRKKKELVVAGMEEMSETQLFEVSDIALKDVFSGLNLYIMTESLSPIKKSRTELEAFAKAHGANTFQSTTAASRIICIADRNLVKVASLIKGSKTIPPTSIIRPSWLFDCVAQVKKDLALGRPSKPTVLLQYEPCHMFFVAQPDGDLVASSIDEWHDGYARDIESTTEMRTLLDAMPDPSETGFEVASFIDQLYERVSDIGEVKGWMFRDCKIYVDHIGEVNISDNLEHATHGHESSSLEARLITNLIKFAAGKVTSNMHDTNTTHIVMMGGGQARLRHLREAIQSRPRLPRIVTSEWISQSWAENTRLDEERE